MYDCLLAEIIFFRVVRHLNGTVFGGNPVVSVVGSVVYVNTDAIAAQSAPVMIQPGSPYSAMPGQPYAQLPGQPVYAQQPGVYAQQPGQPVYVQPGQPQYGQPQYAQVVDPNQVQLSSAPTSYVAVAQSDPAVEPMNITKN